MKVRDCHILFLVVTLFLSSSVFATNKRFALVIGNNDYSHLNSLANPVRDAQAIADKLKKFGFILIDGDGKESNSPVLNLNMTHFAYATQMFAQLAHKAEIVFIYYAGHGIQLEGRSYLLPIDTPLPDIQRDSRLEILRRYAQSLDSILSELDGQAKLTVAVFDACREIPKLDRALRAMSRSTGISANAFRGLARLNSEGRNRIIAYSGGFGQLVSDGDSQHSPYTEILLKNLDVDGIPIEQIFQSVAWQFGLHHHGQNPEVLIQGIQPNHFYFQGKIKAEELALCRQHYQANRLTTGIGGNALDCYQDILTRDHGNADALAGLEAIVEKYVGWAKDKISRGRIEEAKEYYKKAESISPENAKALEIKERLSSSAVNEMVEPNNPNKLEYSERIEEKKESLNSQIIYRNGYLSDDIATYSGFFGVGLIISIITSVFFANHLKIYSLYILLCILGFTILSMFKNYIPTYYIHNEQWYTIYGITAGSLFLLLIASFLASEG